MSNEIIVRHITAKTVYAQVMNKVGNIWNQNSNAFETPNVANWTTVKYCINTSEISPPSAIYRGNFPTIPGGIYGVSAFEQQAGTPNASDTHLGDFQMHWNGSSEIGLYDITLATTNPWLQNGSDPTGVPSPVATNQAKFDYIFAHFRNKRTQDSSNEKLFANDNATVIATKPKSDNGTTLEVDKAT